MREGLIFVVSLRSPLLLNRPVIMKIATFLAGAAVVLCALPACKTQQAGVEQRPANKVFEPAGDMDKDNAPAVLTPEVAARMVAALTRHPEPFVAVRAPIAPNAPVAPTLRAPVGKAVSFSVGLPNVARWSDATVARFVVRLPGGVQDTVPIDEKTAQGAASYTFPTAGPAMLMLCAGPKGAAPVADPATMVTHCSKVILAVGSGGEGGEDFTGETGLPLDVEPLISPVRLSVGSELPVRFHYLGEEMGVTEVVAIRPDGTVDRQATSRSGVAHFQITQAGRWVIRFVKTEPEGDRIGELVFEIAGNQR
jgi:hypothetical protein